LTSRGLDIADVDWIIQYDPPQDPDAFIHRIGRTARMGRAGKALVYLHPTEDTYIEFLTLRKVPISEIPIVTGVRDVLPMVRTMVTKDRELFEKSHVAFVSFIRAYKEHHCSYIFRLNNLDVGKLATGFAMLNLPKMPELKSIKITNFEPSNINLDSIPYMDKAREKQRQERHQRIQDGTAKLKKRKVQTESWSEKKQAKRKREVRKEKKKKVKEHEQEEEAEDFSEEIRMMKKLKKRKISKEEFEEVLEDVGPNENDLPKKEEPETVIASKKNKKKKKTKKMT